MRPRRRTNESPPRGPQGTSSRTHPPSAQHEHVFEAIEKARKSVVYCGPKGFGVGAWLDWPGLPEVAPAEGA